ncbi:MAG: hypothetical protein NXI23_26330 [Bacteroidetes bacterium]|jgi:hypothetical protein|nr:hypothetical protein [Bacteroidota bacterium]MDF1865853.1 hypothetical protein [Saprospiraceae bacterium]
MQNAYKFLTKNGQVVAFGFGLLMVLIFYGAVSSGLEEFSMVPQDEQAKSVEGDIFMPGITLTVWLIILAAVAIIGFGIYHIVTDPKGAIKGIIGLVALLVVFGIAYATSSSEISEGWNTEDVITPSISQYVEGSIKTTGILIGVALVAFVGSEIRNFFK